MNLNATSKISNTKFFIDNGSPVKTVSIDGASADETQSPSQSVTSNPLNMSIRERMRNRMKNKATTLQPSTTVNFAFSFTLILDQLYFVYFISINHSCYNILSFLTIEIYFFESDKCIGNIDLIICAGRYVM